MSRSIQTACKRASALLAELKIVRAEAVCVTAWGDGDLTIQLKPVCWLKTLWITDAVNWKCGVPFESGRVVLDDRLRLEFLVGDVRLVVHLHRVSTWLWEYEVKTTAPGRGGLYGHRSRASEWFGGAYSATIAATIAARDYWRAKGHTDLARRIDRFVADYCFDCDHAAATNQL